MPPDGSELGWKPNGLFMEDEGRRNGSGSRDGPPPPPPLLLRPESKFIKLGGGKPRPPSSNTDAKWAVCDCNDDDGGGLPYRSCEAKPGIGIEDEVAYSF